MYGMIHQGARSLAVARLGQEEWDALAARNGLTEAHFIGLRHSSDAETLRLVGLIAERLGFGLAETLLEFGRSWFEFAATAGFGRTLRMAGGDIETFVGNLERMHVAIGSTMPRARLPSFEIVSRSAQEIRMVYRSERDGLAPFLEGILVAAAERFGEDIHVTHDARPEDVLFVLTRRGAQHSGRRQSRTRP